MQGYKCIAVKFAPAHKRPEDTTTHALQKHCGGAVAGRPVHDKIVIMKLAKRQKSNSKQEADLAHTHKKGGGAQCTFMWVSHT